MNHPRRKKILISALDWGMGHTTRIIPIIAHFKAENCEVFFAGNETQINIINRHFEDISVFYLNGYNVQYSKGNTFIFKIILQIPKIIRAIFYEKKWLANILKTHHFDLIISDNRFGFVNPKVKSIFITHQLEIKTPLKAITKLIQFLNYQHINKFSECWMPDFEDASKNLGGQLSHPDKMPQTACVYIEPTIKFETQSVPIEHTFCCVISGPEPQKSILFQRLFEVAKAMPKQTFVFLMGNLKPPSDILPNALFFELATRQQVQHYMLASEFVVSRSGFTTVMEALLLGKKCLFVPTPGQTEQVYLADYYLQKQWAFSFNPMLKNWKSAIEEGVLFDFKIVNFTFENKLHQHIQQLLKAIDDQ